MPDYPSLVFQAAKLGNMPYILREFETARRWLDRGETIGRVYGLSGGALPALAFALAYAARRQPQAWGGAAHALDELEAFLRSARSRDLRALNLDTRYGFYNLNPLRRRIAALLKRWLQRSDWMLSELPLPLYLCAIDRDAVLHLFGAPDDALQTDYQFVHVGPPQDAPVLDALMASLSTLLSTSPVQVNGCWYHDCRPPIPDGAAIIADLESADSRPILRTIPYTPLRAWKMNFLTTSFLMHAVHERNQAMLVSYYLDLLERWRALKKVADEKAAPVEQKEKPAVVLCHVDLPYVGSTEAATNMRQSVENKDALMARFNELLNGQMDTFPFEEPANIIYGAGGFSGILGGLVTTRAMDAAFARRGGEIRQIYGVSAGVINGFFHAVQVAAARFPDLYRAPAHCALADLESFVSDICMKKFARLNRNPRRFWMGWANLEPLEQFLLERLAAYTGSQHPEQLTFDEIALPFTVVVTRSDGFPEFLGMTQTGRRMVFGGRELRPVAAPVVKAILAGWSMNTYIEPQTFNGQHYQDGGGAFYDMGMFAACLDEQMINLINIHLDEPDGHSYNLPPRPHVFRIVLDTHNYNFPEERRRMFMLENLLFKVENLRRSLLQVEPLQSPPALLDDFRCDWYTPEFPGEVKQ